MRSGIGEVGEDVTDAVEEMNMKRGGSWRERARLRRFCRPARCGANERRRVVKFTVHAA